MNLSTYQPVYRKIGNSTEGSYSYVNHPAHDINDVMKKYANETTPLVS